MRGRCAAAVGTRTCVEAGGIPGANDRVGPRGGRGLLHLAARPARARHRAPRRGRPRRVPGAPRERREQPGHLPHGADRADGPAFGVPCGRRRLHDEAVRRRRAGGADSSRNAPARDVVRGCARRPRGRPRSARGPQGRPDCAAHSDGVPHARCAGGAARRGGAAPGAAGGRMAGRGDRPRQHHRRLHRAAAAQAGRGREQRDARDGPRRGVRAPMSRLTLRGRVTFASVAVLAVSLGALALLFNVLLANRLSTDASSVLRNRAAAQLATLDLRHDGIRTVEGPTDAALDHDAWVFAGSRVVEKPAVVSPATARAVARLASVPHATERTVPGSIRLRAVPVRAPTGERRGTVVVGISLVPYEHTRRIALVGTAILSFLLLAGAAVAVRWSVRSALKPIAEMTSRAADWSEHDLHKRFHLGPPRDELTTLAATFDGLLRRIEAVLRHEQRFSAELAHELRTPLTGLRGEAELSLLRPQLDAESRAAFERIVQASSRMHTVIETLLASARGEAESGDARSSDPLPSVREAMAAVENAARSRGVELRLAEPGSQVVVDAEPDVVTRALYPLLENAVRHGTQHVDVSLSAGDGEVTVTVADDGPGLGHRQPESVFTPGVSSSGGAGLGLPLARRLARSCGGDVVTIPAPGGRFQLTLPGARKARSQGA